MANPLSSTAAPTGNDYGGDEISALVLDPGSSCTRAGFAGEDVPKSVLTSYYGRTAKSPYILGDDAINTPVPDLEILTPMARDGTVEDWDAATKLWEYAFSSRLISPRAKDPWSNGLNSPGDKKKTDGAANGDEDADDRMEVDGEQNAIDVAAEEDEDQEAGLLAEHPLLMTETGWNSAKNREKSIEIAMEHFGVPAFWLARNGVLAAFAAGKPSALVIDVGAASTSVTPVHDGLVLRKGIARSPLAGNYISAQVRHLLSTGAPNPISISPHYTIDAKTPVDAGAPPQATYRSFSSAPGFGPPAQSFRTFQEERVLLEFKECVVQTWPGPGKLSGQAQAPQVNGNGTPGGGPIPSNEELARAAPGRPFEFPDGYNQVFGPERYRAVEALFDTKAALVADASGTEGQPPSAQALPNLIQHALAQVDVDVRPHLLANVVLTGGTSLINGFSERLSSELTAMYPGPRVKLSAPGNMYERRFASWIGGSILASLGTFHQMWISKKEYDEQGPGIVEKRCK